MSKKVFELANEVGMPALELVEKLKAGGFNIRNHMATLTDDELSKAMTMISPSSAEPRAVKKIIKKIVKKAETTEQPQTQVAPAAPAAAPTTPVTQEVGSDVAPKTASPIKRKVSVIRKKTTDGHDEIEAQEAAIAKAEEVAYEEEVIHSRPEVSPTNPNVYYADEKKPLRPVEKPELQAAANAQDRESGKSYFKEKMHTFTPIFTPPVKEKTDENRKEEKKDNQFVQPVKKFEQGQPVSVELTEEDDKDKKRMGGLAAMVSTKKVRDITTIRAEEEIKNYSLGVIGQAVYTPAKRKKSYSGPTQQTIRTEVKEAKRVIQVPGGCTAFDLSQKLAIRFDQLADQALDINLLLKKEDYLGIILASKIAALYQYRVEDTTFKETTFIQTAKKAEVQADTSLPKRSPIIAIMGHVDHGKTSLLDYIRKAKVASGEAGGITQHIGAYQVKVKDTTLTFLDTPGHAAFATMRQRGAKVTDIVVLVVAADDGVMPQTRESIRFIKEAGVPMIVAVNKMDKEGANPDKVKQAMMEFHITPEEWGGDTPFIGVSALKGTGVDDLLETIQLQAEVMELRANPNGPAEAVVIESKIEIGRGAVTTVLIQGGTLKKGDPIVVGETTGRARSLMDYQGNMLNEAGPSTPVQILGLEHPPIPGDILNVVKNEREAIKIVENRVNERKALAAAPPKKMSLEDFLTNAQEVSGKKLLKLVIRADVQGSAEAIKNAVENLGNNEVGVEVLVCGVGPINDNDVSLAVSSKAYILGFNMRPNTTARKIAEDKGVDVKTYSIIYELIDDVTKALEGLLVPERIEKYIGRATVKEVFNIPKIGAIAGSSVIDGKIQRACNIRLLRNGKIIHDGKLATLKRFKDEVKEVATGYECGIALENFNDVQTEDIFEAYIMEEKKRTLEPTSATL
ncbi:MAG: translation initiation factor IF-2 [Bacteriovoracaceae bacterium]